MFDHETINRIKETRLPFGLKPMPHNKASTSPVITDPHLRNKYEFAWSTGRRSTHMAATKPARTGEFKASRTRGEMATPLVNHAASGRIVRLSDPDIRPGVEALKDQLVNDPVAARKWLQELGYLTPAGNVSSRYSGR